MDRNSKNEIEILGWINQADYDYRTARVLINNGLLFHGSVFSCTAIEKYLKMVHKIMCWEIPTRVKHNVLILHNNLKEKGLELELSTNYLESLIKIYDFRYPDNLEQDYNFSINQAKLLAELDKSVHTIRHRLILKDKSNKEVNSSRFDYWITNNDNHLMRMNHKYCNEVKREDLFKNPSIYYEVRFHQGKTLLEADYCGTAVDDGIYLQEGLKPGKTDREFKLNQKAS